MYKDTKNFVRSCFICLSRKNAFKIPPAPHQPVEQSQEPGETCHMDIFGPLKTTPKGNGFLRNVGASGSTDLMAGKVMFLRSNQGGRLDGNESVADSFRSDLVGFKGWPGRIIGAFYSLLRLPEKPSSREAHSLPEVTPSLLSPSLKVK
ncbi:hypothetical protein TNCV_2230571 [Trichonephila clavipes]|uniref:Uncharacterized protein n=1 Tax=Trichonephila clavipes TaxID=2585209 RepID=A0A8X7BJ72_TRICX|nr:hypothetical protein TNCV_2230571 [Trichonephila clavipes]